MPVDDRAIGADGRPVHLAPRYRNVYLHNDRRTLGEPLAPEVAEPLHELYSHYAEETAPAYQEKGRTPVLIVVANTIENATALHRYIAGYREPGSGDDDEAGVWKAGNLELFSNADPVTGRPLERPPTILVHSRLDDPAPGGNDAIGRAIEDQAALFAPTTESEAPLTRAEKQKAIRDVFMSVGRKGEPGEHIRCVISVGMLTEGWDARNVTHIFGYRAFGSQLLCEQVTGRALRKTAFSGRDEKQPIEYANLFGVPFAWPGGKTPGTPPVPVEPQDVYTLPGREHLRLRFPHLAGYARGGGAPRWSIDPRDAPRRCVAPRGPLIGTSVEGPLGEPVLVPRQSEEERTALWKAAAQLVPRLERGVDDRRRAFLDALAILDVCRPNLDCEDWTDLQFDGDTLHAIASRVRRVEGEPRVGAVFDDLREPGAARTSDTGGVRFRTTLRYWYDGTAKSELNAAACHSSDEARLAEILDRHPDVEAWVRNFRLGWTVPWYDSGNACWSRTEPDFVARSKTLTADGRRRFLVIEFKGLLAGEASEEQKRRYLEERWAPAVSRRPASNARAEDDRGDWRAVWIEDIERARDQIARACRG